MVILSSEANFAIPGWTVWVLLGPGLLVVIGTVLVFLFRRRDTAVAGPGYYHILGIDKNSSARRELTIHADSRQSALGKAQFEGIVVTEITQVNPEEQ